jgi:hypothetical protein
MLVSYGYGVLVQALTKNSYLFLNFSDRPVNPYDSLKIKFCLINPLLIWLDLAPRRMPILNPVKVLCKQGAHAGYLESWAPTLLESETLIPCEAGVCCASIGAYDIPVLVSWSPIASHCRIPIGCCTGGPMSADQHKQNWYPVKSNIIQYEVHFY